MSIAATTTNTLASVSNSTTAGSSASSSALSGLSSNFNDFLQMLMTQLQNQDPSSPTDPNQFTSELVQFSSVEQQINTNSNLTQLIQLTQSDQLLQGSAMVGQNVTATSSQLALQDSSATIGFNAAVAGPVTIGITDSSGAQVTQVSVNAVAGANQWSWNGAAADGNVQPDGIYNVSVTGAGATGTSTSIPVTVSGVASGVEQQSGTLQLMLGNLPVSFANVQSVGM